MNSPPAELRICVASSGLGHIARGVEAWAADLGSALASRGFDVLLCKGAGNSRSVIERVIPCRTRESAEARRWVERLPRWLGWRIGMGSPYEVEQTTFAWRLIGLLRRERVDILHVQDPLVALLVQRAHHLSWVPTRAILAHGTEEPLWFQRKIIHLQHLAPWHAAQAESAGVSRPTWTVIPNFIDVHTFRPGCATAIRRELAIPDDAFVVLAAAAIKRKHKRIDYLVDEIGRLICQRPQLPVYLVVAGGWSDDSDELIREGQQRLGDRVRFLVRFPRERMPELYRAADLFTLGSLKEMMPIALLEATASGLPCIIHSHPVMQWMIGPGGQAIDMRKSGELAATLATLYDFPDSRRALGSLARKHCEALFATDRVVKQIEEHYRVVAGVAG